MCGFCELNSNNDCSKGCHVDYKGAVYLGFTYNPKYNDDLFREDIEAGKVKYIKTPITEDNGERTMLYVFSPQLETLYQFLKAYADKYNFPKVTRKKVKERCKIATLNDLWW